MTEAEMDAPVELSEKAQHRMEAAAEQDVEESTEHLHELGISTGEEATTEGATEGTEKA
jgi:hypothetical protein